MKFEEALAGVNKIYAELKMEKTGRRKEDLGFMAPELQPVIQTDQVKALIHYLVERGVL